MKAEVGHLVCRRVGEGGCVCGALVAKKIELVTQSQIVPFFRLRVLTS